MIRGTRKHIFSQFLCKNPKPQTTQTIFSAQIRIVQFFFFCQLIIARDNAM